MFGNQQSQLPGCSCTCSSYVIIFVHCVFLYFFWFFYIFVLYFLYFLYYCIVHSSPPLLLARYEVRRGELIKNGRPPRLELLRSGEHIHHHQHHHHLHPHQHQHHQDEGSSPGERVQVGAQLVLMSGALPRLGQSSVPEKNIFVFS